ncbi:hypothetical protein UUC_17065 [Rhodanobacter denitrificans]|nr:hypothetical protein UUC_17065 [Rhodanobacter denitrificans]KZC21525.1 hypothetical protein RHOFW104R3_01690 [Rhodanobacter denitrificans]
MVLRLVELEKIRASVSVVIWSESQLSADLDQLRIDLEQWSADEVAEYRVFWEEEIRNARYHLDPWSSFN